MGGPRLPHMGGWNEVPQCLHWSDVREDQQRAGTSILLVNYGYPALHDNLSGDHVGRRASHHCPAFIRGP